jgi:hypothetical protein
MTPRHDRDTDPRVRIPRILERLDQLAIGHRLIPAESVEAVTVANWIEANFPISGVQIDWSKVPGHTCLRWHDEDLLGSSIEALTSHLAADTIVVVTWSDAFRPSLELRLRDVLKVGSALFEGGNDTWILSERENWCIEVYHEGTLCLGSGQRRPPFAPVT